MQKSIQKGSPIQKWEIGKAEDRLSELAHQSDRIVLKALTRLAKSHWPDRYLLKFIPLHSYRIRHKLTAQAYVWWVEYDIPPYDLFRCAAYQITLELDGDGMGRLKLRTGSGEYPLRTPISETLDGLLRITEQDRPLMISRDFGSAWD